MAQTEEPTIILYDLAAGSKTAGCFSPNTWRIRLALNYKQLRFKTIWLHYIDIKPTLQGIGVVPPPSPYGGEPRYTVPTLVDNSTPGAPVVITESMQIADYLDRVYPDPPLVPEGTNAVLTLLCQHLEKQLFPVFFPLFVPKTEAFIHEKDRAYIRETFQRWLGPQFEEFISQSEEAREEHWKKLQDELGDLAGLLDQNGEEKPWVLGNTVSRVDFVLIGVFISLGKLDPKGWERIRSWHGGRWERMLRMSESWRANEA